MIPFEMNVGLYICLIFCVIGFIVTVYYSKHFDKLVTQVILSLACILIVILISMIILSPVYDDTIQICSHRQNSYITDMNGIDYWIQDNVMMKFLQDGDTVNISVIKYNIFGFEGIPTIIRVNSPTTFKCKTQTCQTV